MTRLSLAALALALGLAALAPRHVQANATGAPASRANEPPGNQNCTSGLCHTQFALNSGNVTLALTESAAPFTSYTAGQNYTLSFGITSGEAGRQRWGFESIPLAAGDVMAGLFTASPGTLIRTVGARQYITHSSAGTGPAGFAWNVNWRAPVAGTGDVRFFMCGNAANGIGSAGDYIECTVFTVTEAVVNLDMDGDTLLDASENGTCTSASDADTDDDGLSDGEERMGVPSTNPCDCDSDNDTLPDGLELGVALPLPDTMVGAGSCFIADTHPPSTTNPNLADTDGDTCDEAVEDVNRNGNVDGGETDPELFDCPVVGDPELRIERRITALGGGVASNCGLRTQVPEETVMLRSCDMPLTIGCSPSWSLVGQVFDTIVQGPGPDKVLAGEVALPDVLAFYEVEDCSLSLRVTRSGPDIHLDLQ